MSVQLEQAKQTLRKIVRRLLWLFLGIFLLVVIGYYVYSQLTYADGPKSGQLIKISHRGVIFKTYEGTLNLSPNGMMTAWDFSAENAEVDRKLQELVGREVVVHYKQRYKVFFWQGDTEYIVDNVQPAAQ